jgi:uncharacterized membrane protein YadS
LVCGRIFADGLGRNVRGLSSTSHAEFVSTATSQLIQPTNLLIGTSMAAIGLQVDFTLLRKHGPKLMLTAGIAWSLLFALIFALCLIWK